MSDFRETQEFKRGRTGEKVVAELLQGRGWYVIPSYDYAGDDRDKPPRLEGDQFSYAIPDLDVARQGTRIWVEVKSKAKPFFWRNRQRWEHGISRRLYLQYLEVERITGTPVWIAVHEEQPPRVLVARLASLPVNLGRMKKGHIDEGEMVNFARDDLLELPF